MKKDCVILSSWVPSSNRMEPYIRVLVSYYSDCDIYVGVNPSDYAELWIQKLKESGLNIIAEITPKNKPIINAIQMEATASMIVFGSVSLSI